MANKIVLKTPRFKGEFDFDIQEEPLTALEWRWVKKLSGYLPMTVNDGLTGADPDLFIAFAVIALVRAGRVQEGDALAVGASFDSLPFDGENITFIGDQEAEADPPTPAETPATEQPKRSTGEPSIPISDRQEPGLSRIGTPDSVTFAISDRGT